jgi:hypothetical protein
MTMPRRRGVSDHERLREHAALQDLSRLVRVTGGVAHLVAAQVGQANEDDVTILAVRVPLRNATGAVTWTAVREPAIPEQAVLR